ncbi:MAG: hypothetical protein Q9184_008420 [Pyrenodesmia sp. 2 TL-2023]
MHPEVQFWEDLPEAQRLEDRFNKNRALYSGQNTYFHLNHPIRWIRLVGVIVALDVYPNRVVMTLDDSSGLTIDVFCRKEVNNALALNTAVESHQTINLNNGSRYVENKHTYTTNEGFRISLKDIDIGSVVKIKGGISEFRGEKQVTLERISVVRTTNEEASAWAENATFYDEILSKPWVVGERKQQEARVEAEGVKRERQARRDRKRRKKAPEEKEERKARREQERGRGEKSGRGNREKKRETGEVKSTSRKHEVVKTARLHRDTGGKQIVRPAVSGKFDALGL